MFTVVELQTDLSGTTACIVSTYAEEKDAKSRYYSILSSAAVSNVYIHAAAILDHVGQSIMHDFIAHEPTPEPEA